MVVQTQTQTQTEVQTNVPICKTQICKRPLTYLEDSKCWRCLICNPIPKDVPKLKEKKKFLDVAMTEDRVVEIIKEQIGSAKAVILNEERIREIVQDELMNWHIQKPPVTKSEVSTMTAAEVADHQNLEPIPTEMTVKPETWLQTAKRLGVTTHQASGGMRKKVDIMADIERIQDGGSSGSQD